MEIEEEEEQTLIGFCVLGGIFGEGIDLKKDSLIGVIVVGTGLPQVGCKGKSSRTILMTMGKTALIIPTVIPE